jgi:hypothetical protein
MLSKNIFRFFFTWQTVLLLHFIFLLFPRPKISVTSDNLFRQKRNPARQLFMLGIHDIQLETKFWSVHDGEKKEEQKRVVTLCSFENKINRLMTYLVVHEMYDKDKQDTRMLAIIWIQVFILDVTWQVAPPPSFMAKLFPCCFHTMVSMFSSLLQINKATSVDKINSRFM